MGESIQCDIAIIGAGSGGLSIAAVAAQLGLQVVLVEYHQMGGECLNTGCIPSKSLMAAARSAYNFLIAKKFGIEPVKPEIHFQKVMDHVTDVIKTIAPHDSIERFTQLGVRVIKEHAKFIDKKTLIAGKDIYIKARRFIIATGSSPAIPQIPGLKQIDFLTNETIFDLREKPDHLIIIGAGAIGCELAQAFLFLGSKVTVVESFRMMPRDEPDLVEMLCQKLVSQGLILHEQSKILDVKQNNHSIEMIIDKNGKQETITGSHLLVAAGRSANVEDLGLNNAKIAYTAKGIEVNNRMRTTNKRVYAIGDVAGPYQLTHMANYQAGIVTRNAIFKIYSTVNYQSVPWVTYTSPELAHAGLIADEALKQNPDARIITVDLAENDRAQTDRETIGKIKLIATSKGKVLGVSILAEHAGELILPWIMLINDKKTLRSLTDAIVPYPTLNEINKRVASEFYKPLIFSPFIQRLVRYLKFI